MLLCLSPLTCLSKCSPSLTEVDAVVAWHQGKDFCQKKVVLALWLILPFPHLLSSCISCFLSAPLNATKHHFLTRKSRTAFQKVIHRYTEAEAWQKMLALSHSHRVQTCKEIYVKPADQRSANLLLCALELICGGQIFDIQDHTGLLQSSQICFTELGL